MATGKIIQATEGPNLGSAFLANKTNRMFVSRKEKENWNMYVMDLDKFFDRCKQGKVGKPSAYETFIALFPLRWDVREDMLWIAMMIMLHNC